MQRYANILDAHKHLAGVKKGNRKHYIEQHERGDTMHGIFMKKVTLHCLQILNC
jgi:hypothetical protein